MQRSARLGLIVLFMIVVVAAGCSDDPPSSPPLETGDTAVSDFSVRDVNPASPRFDELVSPRDYLGGGSAWYFGHAT